MIVTKPDTKPPVITMITKPIVVLTAVLAAVARWASTDDSRPHLRMVLFRGNEMVATDGKRLVRVPCETGKHAFGVDRAHLLAAVAAQRAIDFEGALTGERSDDDRDDDEPERPPTIALTPVDGMVHLQIVALIAGGSRAARVGIALAVPACDAGTYPPFEAVEAVMPKQPPPAATSPDGYVLDPKFLTAIDEVNAAMIAAPDHRGVRAVAWGPANDKGEQLNVILFTNSMGARFVVMPMRA